MIPIVKYPVYDLNNTLLADAGTELTPSFVEELSCRNQDGNPDISLLSYRTIQQDLHRQITIPPYDIIFSDPEAVSTVFSAMERVFLPLPILQVMDYFRRHDFHTYRHMLIIAALSTLILSKLDSYYRELESMKLTHIGPFHDLGKYCVPLNVLGKKTPLTSTELDLMRHHSVAGYVLLSHYLKNPDSLTAAIALDHHERRNGSGYSRGIRQTNMVIEVTTVCDIYDALVAQRPYRPISYDNRTAIEELTWMAQSGEIGWEAVQVLVALNRRSNRESEEITVSLERRGTPPENNVYGQVTDEM